MKKKSNKEKMDFPATPTPTNFPIFTVFPSNAEKLNPESFIDYWPKM